MNKISNNNNNNDDDDKETPWAKQNTKLAN